jgi:hypothetical protein
MIDLSKIRAALYFKGLISDSQLKIYIMDAYSYEFYSFDETACLIRLLELEAA